MIRWIIDYAIRHRVAVIFGCVLVAALGGYSVFSIRLDAIPNLTDLQVIVKTQYPGQSPEIVEDQVTYPLTTALLSVPEAQAVRGFSMFGESYLYVIFNEGTDPYWARSRVLEYLSRTSTQLPKGVVPVIGPDASGVGWVFEYALVDRQHRHDLAQLRAIQDFYLKYELQGVPGVAEVASVGGIVRQYQVEVDPDRMAAFKVTFNQVAQAIRNNNRTGGGSVVELGRSEFMIRARGYLSSLEDFRGIPVAVSDRGVPVRLEDVARIATGPEPRRGVADLNGQGEVVGGIVVMRYDRNALDTVSRVRDRLEEIKAGLPPGVEIRVTYDRSNLIRQAIRTLRIKLLEEFLVVAIVCWLFLGHFRSAWVAIITLPLGILTAFVIMRVQGIAANIMSLGGIAIALGAMVDAAIVMIENMHKHLERSDWGGDYWEVARQSAQEVGPALFFSLMVITVSFLPVFALTGQEGKLFAPLAYTKTYAMAASALLGITLLPILMGYFIRGRISEENSNPLNRGLQ
ncbi:MAG: CusA/CzcA family heavy metal efflux RND transporter, partial [Ferrovum sp.]|nr:CusA/CzcA family heavy metal efflux RND transporter [Ferrovum sp.]